MLISTASAPITSVDISSIISSEFASLYPSTNPYARACLTVNSVVDQCALVVATLTASAAIESASTSCYCEFSSSLQNGAFEAILSSCESYMHTASQFSVSKVTETYTLLSTPSLSSVSLSSFSIPSVSNPTSLASILPKSIVCNGRAATATATTTGGISSTPLLSVLRLQAGESIANKTFSFCCLEYR